MEEKYKKIYQRLLEDYRFEDGYRYRWRNSRRYQDDHELFHTITQVIENFREKNQEYNVRPDAEYFLLLNFHQMIALPLLLDYSLENKFYIKLNEAIASDIEEILNGAIEESNNREISGHSVVQSLSKRWNQLKTTEFNLWNRHQK